MSIKIRLACGVLLAGILTSCAPAGNLPPAASSQPVTPSSTPAPTCSGDPPLEAAALTDFTEPELGTWDALMAPLREYFYYRKKAIIGGDAHILWQRYPALAQGADPYKGSNAEVLFVESMQELKPVDGNILPEYYERVKVVKGDGYAQVLVHDLELYVFRDSNGRFDDSGGEFKIIVFLCATTDGSWTVYHTQDISGP